MLPQVSKHEDHILPTLVKARKWHQANPKVRSQGAEPVSKARY
jgi:hypothetical protein